MGSWSWGGSLTAASLYSAEDSMFQEVLRRQREFFALERDKVEVLEEEGVLANKFLVGCDPEFVVLDGNGGLVASSLGHGGDIGSDHNGDVVELRPAPAKGTYTLLQHLRELIRDERLSPLKSYKWRAGAAVRFNSSRRSAVTLGGHVHLDLNPYATDYGLRAVNADQALRVRALDHVTRRLEALNILPQTECENRRGQVAGYGKFGDCRIHDEGNGKPRFEYRTMASWLYDPKVAFVCLTAAKLAALDPQLAIDTLGRFHDYLPFKRWFECFKSKDINALRALDKLFGLSATSLQADPDVDFKSRWTKLGF